jgi:hypothetical protein
MEWATSGHLVWWDPFNYLISLIDTKFKCYEQATQEEAKSEL